MYQKYSSPEQWTWHPQCGASENTISKAYAKLNRLAEFAIGSQREPYNGRMRRLIPILADITAGVTANTIVRQYHQELGVAKNAASVTFYDALRPVKTCASSAKLSASEMIGGNPSLQYAKDYAMQHQSLAPKDAVGNNAIVYEKLNRPIEHMLISSFRANIAPNVVGISDIATEI